MAAHERSKVHLERTWVQVTMTLGELAAAIDDSDAFTSLVKEEGCSSDGLKQTLLMTKVALGGVQMLLHRFSTSKLKSPDVGVINDAVARIAEARDKAFELSNCSKDSDEPRSGAPPAVPRGPWSGLLSCLVLTPLILHREYQTQ